MTDPLPVSTDPLPLTPPAPVPTAPVTIVARLGALKVIFLRNPVLWIGFVAAAVQFISAQVFPLTTDQQGAINAVAVAVAGVVAAFAVSADQGVPAAVGALKALIALGLAFGLHLTPDAQSSIMALVTALAAFWVHTQVVAPVPVASLRRP